MREVLFSRMKKQFRKPLYMILMIILGLPTFLVGGICYLVYLRKTQADRKRFRNDVTAALEREGVFAGIEAECRSFLDRKAEFFGKSINPRQYESALQKQVHKEREDTIQKRVIQQLQEAGVPKTMDFMAFLTSKLEHPLLLLLSVISSLPLYVLMVICLNYFTRYSFERIVMMLFVIAGVVLLVFTILHFSSFDPARNILGETATQEQIDTFRATYGLDKSYIEQLFNWFRKIVTFDLGNSFASNDSVLTALLRKFPTTLKLVFLAIGIGVVVALPLGILSSLKPNSGVDYIAMFLAMILMSMPSFWIGMIMLLNFAIKAGWLPAMFDTSKAVTYILPALTMSFAFMSFTTRMTRSSMLEVSRQDYITTARAKGLSNATVVMRHMFRNALIPIITAAGLQMGRLMGGAAVEERVYSVQGIGNYITSSVYIPDIPVVITCVVYTAIIISFANLIVDLLYAILDPGVKANLKKN